MSPLAVQRSTRRASMLLTAAALIASSLAMAAPAMAEPTISVSPSQDLVDGTEVAITATGFEPSRSFGVTVCDASTALTSLTLAACDTSIAAIGRTDATGDASAELLLRRMIEVGGEPIDCAEPQQCIVAAATLPPGGSLTDMATDFAVADISFDPTVPANVAPEVSVQVLTVSTWMARVRVTCSEAAAVNLSVDVTQTAVQNGRYDTLLAGFDTFDCHAGGQNRLVPIAGGPRLRVGDANVVVEAIIRDELDSSSVRHEQEIAAIAAPPPRVDRPSESITINAVRRRVIDDEVRFFVDVTCRRQITVGVSISVTQLIGRRQHRVLGGGNQPCDGDTRVELSLGSPLDEGLIAGRAMISVTAAPTPQGRAPMDVASAWRRTRLPIPIPAAPAA